MDNKKSFFDTLTGTKQAKKQHCHLLAPVARLKQQKSDNKTLTFRLSLSFKDTEMNLRAYCDFWIIKK